MLGIGIIFVFMVFWYCCLGLIVNIVLLLNLIVLVGLMLLLLGVVLILLGIVGFVLMIGMVVDMNVIIFEWIKEEKCKGWFIY